MAKIKILLMLFIVLQSCDRSLSSTLAVKESGHCVMYGECALNKATGRSVNCLYTGKAKLLQDPEGLDILEELCPYLHKGNETYTCCDTKQLHTIKENLKVPYQSFSRCPTCFYNFVSVYCGMICGPNQTVYTNASKVGQGDSFQFKSFNNKTYVTELGVNMTKRYTNDLFESCRHVTNPATNDPAIYMLCGPNGDSCTGEKWITYMNSAGNGFAPFDIKIDYTTSRINSMDFQTIACNESVPGGDGACSCNDCPASCSGPPPTPPAVQEPVLLFNNDPQYVIMLFVFCGVSLVFMFAMLAVNIRKYKLSQNENYLKLLNAEESHGNMDLRSINKEMADGEEEVSKIFRVGLRMDQMLQMAFQKWGMFCASHPYIILVIGVVLVAVCTSGLTKMQVTTDPVELWSAPDSQARQRKNYFDSHFGPFYRTEQVIITAPYSNITEHKVYSDSSTAKPRYVPFGPILRKDVLHKILKLQLAIESITVWYAPEKRNITLRDICFQPLEPTNRNCTVMSVLNYFQNDPDILDKEIGSPFFGIQADYHDHLMSCTSGPTTVDDATKLHLSCLGKFGGPIFPWVALGGYDGKNYLNATAAVITFPVNNVYGNESGLGPAMAWEKEFLTFMKSYINSTSGKNDSLKISFSAERSIEDEINRESGADIMTILTSYLIMFAYVAIALGRFASCNTGRIMIDCKLTVGLAGVLIVMCSVGMSLGIFSYAGVPLTLIIVEVVPFLVLAVGVDNIFILVQHYQRDERNQGESAGLQLGRILGEVAPSMFMSSMSESLAFFLGGLSTMPAVKTFSMFAGLAVLVDFILQMTCFVAILSLDIKRQNVNRYDCCCCIQDHKSPEGESDGLLHRLMKNVVSKIVLSEYIRPLVVILFFGMACFSGAVLHKIDVGLDQALSMPSDSYVLDYFAGINKYLDVGAPVYFVIPEGYNYTSKQGANQICGGNGCNDDSLIQKISVASQMPNYSRIAFEASSWLDDYFAWLKPLSSCCRYFDNMSPLQFCNSTVEQVWLSQVTADNCSPCRSSEQTKKYPRPTPEEFMEFLPWFLHDNPGQQCAKGGHAAYGSGVKLLDNNTEVGATYFMTYHTVARTSQDFIQCLEHANSLAKNITASLNGTDVEVFPYSVFYVYYEQYLTIVHDTIFNLGISLFAIFLIAFLTLSFDILSALIIVFTISLIILNMFGVMFLWQIPLNAVSLVNLVMAVGISVEFCAHITRAFALSQRRKRVTRAEEALAEMGSSVLSGITLTKFVGIAILAFSKSQIFRIFYFRMYLAIVLLGASHGLVFLPVLLSYIGPKRRPQAFGPSSLTNVKPESNEIYSRYGSIDHQGSSHSS